MALGVVIGVVGPTHGVSGVTALVTEDATTVEGTITALLGLWPDCLAAAAGLCRASGCSAIVVSDGGCCSSVSIGMVWLALVGCGSPNNAGPVASSGAFSSVVSAVRPAKAAMGAIMTAAKHPRPLAGRSR